MKFTCQVDINVPRDRVVELFDNPDNMQHWQDGFVSFESLSGEPGMPGAKSKICYRMNNRDMELTETILVNDLPNELTGDYRFFQGANTMKNTFERLPNGGTRYKSEVDYYETNAFMMKVMMKFFPKMFKKQVQKWMDQFKAFAEKESGVV